jgi:hypothetical protein
MVSQVGKSVTAKKLLHVLAVRDEIVVVETYLVNVEVSWYVHSNGQTCKGHVQHSKQLGAYIFKLMISNKLPCLL